MARQESMWPAPSRKVIAVGDQLEGKVVAGLRFGRDGLVGNRLGFTATFADGSEGVFATEVDASMFSFTGFFPPVNNLPVVNGLKAGEAVPVKFSLHGYQGLDIFAAGYPKSVAIRCDGDAPARRHRAHRDGGPKQPRLRPLQRQVQVRLEDRPALDAHVPAAGARAERWDLPPGQFPFPLRGSTTRTKSHLINTIRVVRVIRGTRLRGR